MKVGYIQTSPLFGEKNKNFEQVENLVSKLRADLLVLPELFATGYAFVSKEEVTSLAEEIDGDTSDFLIDLSRKTNSIIVGGFIEKNKSKIFNSAMIVSDSKISGVYRKLHLYFKEKFWFTPGNKPPKIFKVKNIKIGIMICFDWIFPEMVRSLALLGADIIAHPTNLVLPYCQNAMITRCIENRIFAITSNRIGEENRGSDHFKFTGKSQIISCNGEILSSAPKDEIIIDLVNIDINKARDKKINEFNDLFEDRREKLYYNIRK